MNKKDKVENQENRDNQQPSEFYNRPGSTEHNDYRISGKNENLSVDKKNKKDGYKADSSEAIDNE
jgi:hypothetical protein